MKKKDDFQVRTLLYLTMDGVSFFMNNNKQPIKKDGILTKNRYTLELNSFNFKSIQKLILNHIISGIEIKEDIFQAERHDILDINKIIIYTFLYERFNAHFFSTILQSDFIQRWNRKNPSQAISESSKIHMSFEEIKELKDNNIIKHLKSDLLNNLLNQITNDNHLPSYDKNIKIFLANRFLDNLKPIIWVLLSRFLEVDGFEKLIIKLENILKQYIQISYIIDYISKSVVHILTALEQVSAKQNNQRPEYLEKYGTPQEPRELLNHNCLRYRFPSSGQLAPWVFEGDDGAYPVKIQGNLITNSSTAAIDQALQGLGLTFTFRDYCTDALASGALIEVLSEHLAALPSMNMYFPKEYKSMLPLRLLIEHLKNDELKCKGV